MPKLKIFACFFVLFLWQGIGRASVSFNAELESKYDTNVFNYSRDDIDEFEANTNPDKFNRVKSIDDFIISPAFGLIFSDKLFNHTFRLNLEAEPHFFTQNKIKDYESYRLNVNQYLSKGEYLEFRYQHIPDYFLKNLLDRDLNEFRKAAFDVNLYSFGYRRPLNKNLDARLRYLYEVNDYNENFEEYDMRSNAVNLALWHKLKSYFTTEIDFEFERADAKGNLVSTARIESDTSYDKYELGLRENLQAAERINLYLWYIFSFRKYTTDNPLTDDPFHIDRQDKIQRAGLGLTCGLSKNTQATLEYEYSAKDVNTASEDPALINAAILGYEKSIVSLRVNYRF